LKEENYVQKYSNFEMKALEVTKGITLEQQAQETDTNDKGIQSDQSRT